MTPVTLNDELADGIDQFIADRNQPPRGKMSYDDAVNIIVTDWLMGQGYLALPGDAEPVTTSLEAAKVPTI